MKSSLKGLSPRNPATGDQATDATGDQATDAATDPATNELAAVGTVPPASDRVLSGFFEWFRSMLYAFLIVYATLLSTIATAFRSGRGRLLVIPLLSLPVLLSLRDPVVRRGIVRSLRRGKPLRPFALVALGSASLCLWLALVPSMERAPLQTVAQHLGPVDEFVIAATPEARLEALAAIESARRTVAATRTGLYDIRDTVDSQLTLTTTSVQVSVDRQTVAAEALEFDQMQARSFGGDAAATGLGDAEPLQGDSADVGADLAADLGLRPGMTVRVGAGISNATFTVRRVLPRRGLAALSTDGRLHPRVLLIEPGRLSANAAKSGARTRYLLAFSNRGTPDQAWKRSAQVASALTDALQTPRPDGGRIAAVATAASAEMHASVRRSIASTTNWLRVAQTLFGLAGCCLIGLGVVARVRTRDRDRRSFEAAGVDRRTSTAIVWGELVVIVFAGALLGAALIPLVGRLLHETGSTTAGVLDLDLRLRSIDALGLVLSFATGTVIARLALTVGSRAERDARVRQLNTVSGRMGRTNRALLAAVCAIAAILLMTYGVVEEGALTLLLGAGLLLAVTTLWFDRRRPVGVVVTVAGSLLLIVVAFAALSTRTSTSGSVIGPVTNVSAAIAAAVAVAVAVASVARLRRSLVDAPAGRATPRHRATVGSVRRWPDVVRACSLAFAIAGTAVVAFASASLRAATPQDRYAVAVGMNAGQLAALRQQPTAGEVLAFRSRLVSVTSGVGAPVLLEAGARATNGFGDGGATATPGPLTSAAVVLDDPLLKNEDAAIVSSALRDRLGPSIVPGQRLRITDAATGLQTTVTIARMVAHVAGLPEIVVNPALLDELPQRNDDVLGALVRLSDRAGLSRTLAGSGIRILDPADAVATRPAAIVSLQHVLRRLLLIAPVLAFAGLFAAWFDALRSRSAELAARRAHGDSPRSIARHLLGGQLPLSATAIVVGLVLAGLWGRATPGFATIAASLAATAAVLITGVVAAARRS